MLPIAELNRALQAVRLLADTLGDDASLRQVHSLLLIAQAGDAGSEQSTIEKHLGGSQATASRNIKLMTLKFKLAEFKLDPTDGRRRLVVLTRSGKNLLQKLLALFGG